MRCKKVSRKIDKYMKIAWQNRNIILRLKIVRER